MALVERHKAVPDDSFVVVNEDFFEASHKWMVEGGEDTDLVYEHQDDVEGRRLEVQQLQEEVLFRLDVLHFVTVDLVVHTQEVQHLVSPVQDVAVVRDVHLLSRIKLFDKLTVSSDCYVGG